MIGRITTTTAGLGMALSNGWPITKVTMEELGGVKYLTVDADTGSTDYDEACASLGTSVTLVDSANGRSFTMLVQEISGDMFREDAFGGLSATPRGDYRAVLVATGAPSPMA